MNVLLLHGAYGGPEENWFPWLKKQLQAKGHQVFAPRFSTPENQSLENWLGVLRDFTPLLDGRMIIVAHSLGCALALRQLELVEKKIKGLVCVAGFIGGLSNASFDQINASFFERDFGWEKIKGNVAKAMVFHADNDPFVPLEKGRELAEKLAVKLTVVKGAGHFNEKAGYIQFPLLLEKIGPWLED